MSVINVLRIYWELSSFFEESGQRRPWILCDFDVLGARLASYLPQGWRDAKGKLFFSWPIDHDPTNQQNLSTEAHFGFWSLRWRSGRTNKSHFWEIQLLCGRFKKRTSRAFVNRIWTLDNARGPSKHTTPRKGFLWVHSSIQSLLSSRQVPRNLF